MMWLGILTDLALCAGIALLLWAPSGRWAADRIGAGRMSAGLSVSIALGMGIWGYWILVLGLIGGLYRLVLLASAVVFFLALGVHRRLMPSGHAEATVALSWRGKALVCLLGLLSLGYLGLVVGSALAPETAFDSLNVHLPYARDAAVTHRAGFAANNWSSAMPALPLMSYITAFLVSGVTLAKLFNALCYVLCGFVTYGFARRWWGRARAMAAAALFWSCPVALYEATTALIDLPLALYSGVAVFALLEWTLSDESPFLWLSAISLGCALGCKYHAAFWIVPFLSILIWHTVAVRRQALRAALSLIFRYGLIVLLVFLPWLARSWFYTGNPVFPLANGIFKSPYFPPSMEEAARAMYSNEGIGRSWWSLIRLPWAVAFDPQPFRGTVGIVLFFGMVLVCFRRKTRQVRYLLFAAATFFYAWAMTAQEIRYLLPLVPVLAVLTSLGCLGSERREDAAAAAAHADSRAPFSRAATYAGVFILCCGVAMSLPSVYSRWAQGWSYWHSYKSPLPYLLGRESAEEYVERDVPSIYVYEYVNRHLSPRDRILLLNDASQFYSQVPTLYSFTVEGEALLLERTEEGVLRRLKESGITHVLLNYNGLAPLPGVAPRRGVYFFLDQGFQQRHLEPIYARNNVTLYRLRSS